MPWASREMIDVGFLSWADLRRGYVTQFHIVGALMMREMRTRFGNRQFGYAWALIEPLIQIGILVFIFRMLGRRPPLGTSFEAFFLNGFVPYSLFNQISLRSAQAIVANRALLALPPIRNMDTVWARIILEAVTGTVSLILLMAIFGYFGVPIVPNDLLQYVLGLASAISLGAGIGVFNASVSSIWNIWPTIYSWFARLQYFLCGVFFLPDFMPPTARSILAYNPLAHCLMWIREGFYSGYESIILDKYYPITFAIIAAILGMTIERVFRRQVEQL